MGDPLCATTHVDILLRCRKEGIAVEVIHNASVMNAVAVCGLPLYQFGYSVSIPLFENEWRPSSFYERIQYNQRGKMHTLCLLDIKVKEPDYEAMTKKGQVKFLPPRFMTVTSSLYSSPYLSMFLHVSVSMISLYVVLLVELIFYFLSTFIRFV